MTETAKHTPTPWQVFRIEGDLDIGLSSDNLVASLWTMADHGEREANAELIVDAVNSHTRLIADRAALLSALHSASLVLHAIADTDDNIGTIKQTLSGPVSVLFQIDAAIRQVEETTKPIQTGQAEEKGSETDPR